MTVQGQDFTFEATDGYPLAGCHYRASDAKGVILIASATGVPQGFYRRFAEYATTQGFSAVTFDYRGIGRSAPKSLKGFEMDFRDWARKDLSTLVDRLQNESTPLYLVGHSYGGHALGLIDNHRAIRAACFLGTGAGWHGWMPRLESLRVRFMWHGMAPLLTGLKGYLAWSRLGMGEDLPLGVYQQWKRWCGFPHYFFDDPEYPEVNSQFSAVRTPIQAINAVDDKWAMLRSRDAFMQFYAASVVECVDLVPQDIGLREIGHMGYFRSRAQALWPEMLAYFKRH